MKYSSIAITLLALVCAILMTTSYADIDPDHAFVLINEFGLDRSISKDDFNNPDDVWSMYRFPEIIRRDTTETFAQLLPGRFYVRIHFQTRRTFRMVFITREREVWDILRQFSEGEGKEMTLRQANSLRHDTRYEFTAFKYITDAPILVPAECAPDLSDPDAMAAICGGKCPGCMAGFACSSDEDCLHSLTCSKEEELDPLPPDEDDNTPQQEGGDEGNDPIPTQKGVCIPTNAVSIPHAAMAFVVTVLASVFMVVV